MDKEVTHMEGNANSHDLEHQKPLLFKDTLKHDQNTAPLPLTNWRNAIVVLILMVLPWTTAFLAWRQSTFSAGPQYTYDEIDLRKHECGSSVSEARLKGCHWDPVSFAWLPERCLDKDLAHDLLTKTNWTLHANLQGTITKSDHDFSQDESKTYLTNANHALHCIYSWKRMHRSLLAGKPYHSGLSYQHTMHCSKVLTESSYLDPDEIKTRALVIFPAC